jgi:hypothetical protein
MVDDKAIPAFPVHDKTRVGLRQQTIGHVVACAKDSPIRRGQDIDPCALS